MLTNEEILVVADAAENYPSGFGFSYFSDLPCRDTFEAIRRINRRKECLQYG